MITITETTTGGDLKSGGMYQMAAYKFNLFFYFNYLIYSYYSVLYQNMRHNHHPS